MKRYLIYPCSGGFVSGTKQTDDLEVAEKHFNKFIKQYNGIRDTTIVIYDNKTERFVKEHHNQ